MVGAEAQSKARELAMQAALSDTSWMSDPERVATWGEAETASRLTVVPLRSDLGFEDVLFFAVVDPTQKPGTRSVVVVVIGNGGKVIRGAEDFQQLIVERRITDLSTTTVLDLATQYVSMLGFNHPQYADLVKILHSSQDIPLRPDEGIPTAIESRIQAPEVQPEGTGFFVGLYAWSEVGGELRSFEIRITGERFEANVELLACDLGRAWLPK